MFGTRDLKLPNSEESSSSARQVVHSQEVALCAEQLLREMYYSRNPRCLEPGHSPVTQSFSSVQGYNGVG